MKRVITHVLIPAIIFAFYVSNGRAGRSKREKRRERERVSEKERERAKRESEREERERKKEKSKEQRVGLCNRSPRSTSGLA